MPKEFKRTDFVQVEYVAIGPDFITEHKWRNALFVAYDGDNPIVQYTDGSKEMLHGSVRIRKTS